MFLFVTCSKFEFIILQEENGFVHGNIRCRKLLVHVHSDTSFIIKLANPGLFFYTQSE